jgi:hypothetical protein
LYGYCLFWALAMLDYVIAPERKGSAMPIPEALFLVCCLYAGVLEIIYDANRIIRRIPSWIITQEGILGDWSFWGNDFAVIKWTEIVRIERSRRWSDSVEITLTEPAAFKSRLGLFGRLTLLFMRSGPKSFNIALERSGLTATQFLDAVQSFYEAASAGSDRSVDCESSSRMRKKGYALIAAGLFLVPLAAVLLGMVLKQVPVHTCLGMLIGFVVNLQGCD